MTAKNVSDRVNVPRKADWMVAYIALSAVGLLALVALIALSGTGLLGASPDAIPSTFQGIAVLVYVIVATAGVYVAYLLHAGKLDASDDTRIL